MPETMHETIAILLVDDHALFRESLVRLLHAEPNLEVVAHSGSIEEALNVLQKSQIDVVLLDIDLGERSGTEFLSSAMQQGFSGKVLVVTAGVNQTQASELIQAGIAGIFMKHQSATVLAEAIRDVVNGKVFFDQRLLQTVMAVSARPTAHSLREQFTQRERQVLSFVFEGLANKEKARGIWGLEGFCQA